MKFQNKSEEMEIYIHIPFCVKKCDYCDFLSGPADDTRKAEYVKALMAEIHSIKACEKKKVVSIFIGGGTPSAIHEKYIKEILEAIREKFMISEDAEISIETNPGTLTENKLRTYLEAGINRISIGLQSANDRELKNLGRIHSYDEFLKNYDLARKVGFSNINVDLMFAIPEQSYEGWVKNLRTIAELSPEHISAYSLIVEEGTPFFERELLLPDEEEEYRMYEDTAAILAEYGYAQYEISNYAKKGYACRHNVGYWKRREYLGIGLGASSMIGQCRFSNTDQMDVYLKESSNLKKIRENKEILSKEDQMSEFMFLGLRMTKGISREEFKECFGYEMNDIYEDVLEKHKKTGLLIEENGKIYLSRQGIHVSNSVMADFLL